VVVGHVAAQLPLGAAAIGEGSAFPEAIGPGGKGAAHGQRAQRVLVLGFGMGVAQAADQGERGQGGTGDGVFHGLHSASHPLFAGLASVLRVVASDIGCACRLKDPVAR